VKKTFNLIIVALILGSIIFGASASFGSIIREMNPTLSIRQEYDDNIFREKTDKNWDLITTVTPRMSYVIAPKKPSASGRIKLFSQILLNLSTEIIYYANNSHLNENIIENGFLPSLSMNAEITDRLNAYYNVSKNLDTRSDLYAREDITKQEEDKFVESWDQNYGVNYMLGPKDFPFDLAYDHSDTLFITEKEKDESNYTDTFSITNSVKFLGDTFWFFMVEEEHTTYPKKGSTNTVFDDFTTGVRGQFSPKISGVVSGGYSIRRGGGGGHPTVDISLVYQFSPKLSFDASYNMDFGETEELGRGSGQTKDLSFGVNYKTVLPGKRISLTCGASAEFRNETLSNDGSSETMERTYELTVEASYKMNKAMDLSLGYEYTMVVSPNNTETEYRNNIVYVELGTSF